MRGKRLLTALVVAVCAFTLIALGGCGENRSGSTIDEPEITGEYLSGEYSQQLITDGAETVVGLVTMEKNEDGSYGVHIAERQVVKNSKYEEGYYIADNNVALDVTLGDDGRIACMKDGELQVVDADKFIDEYSGDEEQLYTIYLMGESAELILATDPVDVETE